MSPTFSFDNSFLKLPAQLYQRITPTAVAAPQLLLLNAELMHELGIDATGSSDAALAQVFSGNEIPLGAEPIAQAYAGHQFGYFTMLGDGRAILLGEQLDPSGKRFDIQLKGAGRTAFSRGGDGRATLSSMLREYLISEAIHHLGIPGSRSLAVVGSGEQVRREQMQPGAILTRVMESHLRVGTFEYARQYLSENELQALTDYAIERHYPHLATATNKALALLEAVMEAQISLVCHWMRVGFIHGVMNTDNAHIAGLSFDFGPCAFMNAYHPGTVFSSIDRNGRYAFGQQASIAQWNMGVLGGALLPLIHTDEDEAIALARSVLNAFPERFRKSWEHSLAGKLGFERSSAQVQAFASELLKWMQDAGADYTNTFRALMDDTTVDDAIFKGELFTAFRQKWLELAAAEAGGVEAARAVMRRHNPQYIPRNHLVEAGLKAASEQQDFNLFHEILKVLRTPYDVKPGFETYQMPAPDGDQYYRTFCGT